jgi:antitoxin PrlF
MTSTLTSKGQVTIPKAIRERLKLEAGDRLGFFAQPDGTLQVIPLNGTLQDLKGFLPRPSVSLTLEELDGALGAAVLEEFSRSDRD